jgi:hypothetical protein
MSVAPHASTVDILADPFGELQAPALRERLQLLGAHFEFESNSPELLGLVASAYAGLPPHRLSSRAPRLKLRLVLASAGTRKRLAEPPALGMFCAGGLLVGATAGSNLVALSPQDRSGLVVVDPKMLRFPYHTRYELIEFAVFTLAARVQSLVPLHAACVGMDGRGVLLMGPSGSGKSTVTLQCLLQGFDFLSEDSTFVTPESLIATGVANFIHVRSDSLRWIAAAEDARAIHSSPVIRRRSGVRKFEVDLRRGGYRLATKPLKIVAVVFLSAQAAGDQPLLTPLKKSSLVEMLADAQAYAASRPEWDHFRRSIARIEALELRRGRHPLDAVEALRGLLAPTRRAVSKRART